MTVDTVLYGGSFDPIHLGHLVIANEACDVTGCASVLFVPTWRNPLKADRGSTAYEDRLAMVRAATRDNPRFAVSEIERRLGDPSYSMRTIDALQPDGRRPWFLIGEDLVPELPRWREHERLCASVRFLVATRGGTPRVPLPPGSTAVPNPALDLSSGEIRRRLRAGRPIRYLVPEQVHDYIRANQLYRP